MFNLSDIKKAIEELVGKKMSIVRRAATMRNFQFGKITLTEKGSVGEYALHVQCPWRFEGSNGIITGFSDLRTPIDPSNATDDWDYEKDGNLQDKCFEGLFGAPDMRTRSYINSGDDFVVASASVNKFGDLAIEFTKGYALSIFPAGIKREHWRFFVPGDRKDHFVFSN